MKKLFLVLLILSSLKVSGQNNTLLNSDFWKRQPSLEDVKNEIAQGNSASEANRGNFDVVCMAINNRADNSIVRYLLTLEGNEVDKKTHDGRTYLHWAASAGNVEIVKYLIELGWNPEFIDEKGASPLVFGASAGMANIEVYKAFFEVGISPQTKYANGANILLLGILGDDDLELATYLETKGLSIQAKDDLGRTAFDYAARSGKIELLEKISDKKIEATPAALLFAAQGTRTSSSTLDTYKYLVEKKKINVPDAIGINHENVLQYLVRKPKQLENILYLVDKGASVEQVNNNGNNVLMESVYGKNVDVVEYLISHTKNIQQTNQKEETALMIAIGYSSPEIVELLLNQGVQVNSISQNGNLAYYLIHSYRANNDDEFNTKWKLLKERGFDLNQIQTDGKSILHLAVTKNDLKLLKKVTELEVDINIQDKEGLTALHQAALIAQNDEILKYLVELGADKSLETEFGETAYDLANENERLIKNNMSLEFLK